MKTHARPFVTAPRMNFVLESRSEQKKKMNLEVDGICALELFAARVHFRDGLGNVVRRIRTREFSFNNKKSTRPNALPHINVRVVQNNR